MTEPTSKSRALQVVDHYPLVIEQELQPDYPLPKASRVSFYVLVFGFLCFLVWATWAPLDEGVTAQGTVSVDTKRKTVQHLNGGLIREVLVREGQMVKEGQVLVRLEPDTAKVNLEASRQRYYNLRAMEGRLVAEQLGASQIKWHPDLLAASKNALVAQQMQLQEQLLNSRRASLRADLSAFEQNIQGQQAVIQAGRGMLENKNTQIKLLNEELEQTKGLVVDGYAPKNRQLELERSVEDAVSSKTDLQGRTSQAQQSIAEMRQRIIARQQEYRKEIETQRADVSREVEAEAEKFDASQKDLSRTDIRSPVSGQVVDLAVQTLGGVVAPGQKLMDIVPQDELLIVEAKLPPQMIDRVKKDLPVDIRFSAFSHTPTLVIEGRVVSLSTDAIKDPQGAADPYYLARVQVTPEGLKKLGSRNMQAGMKADVVIRTGERSLLTYVLGPLVKRLAASMKEE